jgi:hypothetical protein
VPPARSHRPQRSTSAAVVLTAMLLGGVLGWHAEDEAHADTGSHAAVAHVQEAGRTPAPVRKADALSPITVLSAEPGLADPPAQATEQLEPETAHVHHHREPALVGAARGVDDEALEPPDAAPLVIESAQPAMLMEGNPYLHGR